MRLHTVPSAWRRGVRREQHQLRPDGGGGEGRGAARLESGARDVSAAQLCACKCARGSMCACASVCACLCAYVYTGACAHGHQRACACALLSMHACVLYACVIMCLFF